MARTGLVAGIQPAVVKLYDYYDPRKYNSILLRLETCLAKRLRDKRIIPIVRFNPLPDMPILGFSNSVTNKDMMSKIWTDGDTII